MGQILALTGYLTPSAADPVPLQPLQAVQAIRVFMGPVPAVLIVLAVLCAWRYPISRSRHAVTLERLAAGESPWD